MATNCKNCKFYDVDYVWDDECEDEVREESCTENHRDELENDEIECPFFKKYRQKRYVEEDTRCDLCELKDQCNLTEVTMLADTRKHYINAMGDMCKKETGVDISLKALQEYADEKGIKKKIEDMTFSEKDSLRFKVMFRHCAGKEVEELTNKERKEFAKVFAEAFKKSIFGD